MGFFDDAWHAVTHPADTVSDAANAVGQAASDAANAVAGAAGDAAQAAGNAVTSGVNAVENAAGDIVQLGVHEITTVATGLAHTGVELGTTIAHDASDAFTTVVNGATKFGNEALDTGKGFANALGNGDIAEAGSTLAQGVLDMAGTAAGTAGQVFKDYESGLGAIVKGGADGIVTIADGETDFVTGTIGIGAHTVGTPLGDFYANVASGYGDAIKATLDDVKGALEDGTSKLTGAAGDLAVAAGHGADQVGHDAGAIAGDLGHGDLKGAGHDATQLGNDAFDAGKDFASAEIEGAKALASASSDVGKILNGLNEAMARGGGAFVSAVGKTIGGDAGHDIDEAGQTLGGWTGVASNLVQGDFKDAAKAGVDLLGGAAGKWASDHIHDWANSLGDHVGGVVGDGIKMGGDQAGDAASGGVKDLTNWGYQQGVDAFNGGSSKSDAHGDGSNQQTTADNSESLWDKGWHAGEQVFHDTVHKVEDTFNQVIQHPETLLDQGANWIHDNIGKGVPDALSKLTGLSAPTHASPSTSGAGETTGTTHSALTADNGGQSGVAGPANDTGMPNVHVTDPASPAGSGGFSTVHADAAPSQVGDGMDGQIFTDHLARAVDAVIGQVGDAAGGPAITDNAQVMGGFSTSMDPPSAGLGNGAFWDQVAQAVSHVTTAGFPPAADAAPLTTPQVGDLTHLDLTHLGNLGDVVGGPTHDPVAMQAPDSGIHISALDVNPVLQDHGMASTTAAVNPQPVPASDVIDYGGVAASPHYDYHLG